MWTRRLRGRTLLACLIAGTVSALAGASSASAAWRQPVPAPLDAVAGHDTDEPELIEIGGVPHVAWHEDDGTNWEVRVSRLNSAGTAWEEVVGGPSPINRDPEQHSDGIDLAAIDGKPWVAWTEWDGVNWEVRVARPNALGTEWVEVGVGPSPINHSSSRRAYRPSLTSVGGVPHIAWTEAEDHGDRLWVARLNEEEDAWEEVGGLVSGYGAVGTQLVDVGGVPYVAWHEPGDGRINQVRVSRLNAERTAWERVGGQINLRSDRNAIAVGLAEVAGVPYVTWGEYDGGEHDNGERRLQIRVSRLGSSGVWEEIVGGPSPINHDPAFDGFTPTIASIGGRPYVAWAEPDGNGDELRVSRLNAEGTAWEEVVGGASPINSRPDAHAFEPSLLEIGGVPYVAWRELRSERLDIRVSRLEPDFLEQTAVVSGTKAVLMSKVRTWGVEYPIAFQYGVTSGLLVQTGISRTTYGAHEDTVVRRVSPVVPEIDYHWRSIGFDGHRITGTGPMQTFSGKVLPGPPVDLPVDPPPVDPPPVDPPPVDPPPVDPPDPPLVDPPVPGDPPPAGPPVTGGPLDDPPVTGGPPTTETPPGPADPQGPADPPGLLPDPVAELRSPLLVAALEPRLTGRSGRRVKVRYALSRDASVGLDVRRCGGKTVASVASVAARAGVSRIAWDGRLRGGRTAAPGCYILALRATEGGQRVGDLAKLRLTRR